MTKSILNFISVFVLTYMAIDVLGAIWWAMSGQIPTDNFFLGSITREILQLFIK
jgi:hypothetical protein